MTSARLMEWLRDHARGMDERGNGDLVRQWVLAEEAQNSLRMDQYLRSVESLQRRATELDETDFARFARYLVGRSLAFALDRPEDSLDLLVDLLGDLRRASGRSILATLTELELMRAYHKIDAPGFRDSLLAGLDDLWDRLRGDVVPRLELLDVWWRTGFWCRDAEVMQRGLARAYEEPAALVGSWPYWEARRRWLLGEREAGIELLTALLEDMAKGRQSDTLWRLYVEVELGLQEAEAGEVQDSERRLLRVIQEASIHSDPMLHWNLVRFRAAHHRALDELAEVVAAWRQGLEVVATLGLDRLRAEFALSLVEAGWAADDAAAMAEGRALLGGLLPKLRSREDLERRLSFLD